MHTKLRLLILSATLERSIPHHHTPFAETNSHTETHRLHLQNISCFNYRISTCREHKLPRISSSNTSNPSYLHLHFLPFPKDFYSKTTYSEYQTQQKKIGNRQNLLYYSSSILTISFLALLAISPHTSVSSSRLLCLISILSLLPAIFLLFPHVGFSSKLPSPTQCRSVPPHRPSHHFLPPSLNQLQQLS